MTQRKLILWLFLIGFLTYFFSFGNQFVWDDEQFIQKNVFLTDAKYLPQIFTTNTIAGAGHQSNYYRPLTTLGFWVDYHLWGLNPFGFHLSNTLLHVGAGILLFLLLQKLKFGRLASFWVSLIFLVHPIQTEAVVYMNSRGDPQYLFWAMMSFWLFTKSLANDRWRMIGRGGWLILSVLSYAASILSKEIALSLVAFYPILIITHLMVNRESWRMIWTKYWREWLSWGVMIGLVGVYMGLRLTVLNFDNTLNFYGYENEYTRNVLVRLFTFSKIVWIYLGLLIWPYPLHMERSSEIIYSATSPWVWATVSLIVGLAGLMIWRLKKSDPWILFGLSLSVLSLVPVSGLIPINGLLYEHWLYLPMIGLTVAIFALGKIWFKPRWQVGLLWLGGGVVTIYVCLTLYQNSLWSTPIKFYEYTLQYARAARLHNNLAMAYSEQQRLEEAIVQYKLALELSDTYPQTHHNLGNVYVTLGKYDEAETEYLKALQLDPQFWFTYSQIIRLYLTTKQPAKALPYVEKVYSQNQNNIETNLVYAKTWWDLKDHAKADQYFQKALDLSRQDPQINLLINQLKTTE